MGELDSTWLAVLIALLAALYAAVGPGELAGWAPAAVAGGLVGATVGSRRLARLTIRRLLAVVLVLAAVKMLLM
ncbi:MAG: hypothetical protein WD118_08405 [Phycisphaeraceae bacterium]